MNIHGPNWPSTLRLREALQNVKGPDIQWGSHSRNGLDQLQLFTQNQIPCPIFTTDQTTAKEWARSGIETWGRSLHHSQGTDIIGSGFQRKLTGEIWNRKWLQRDFWVQRIPFKMEFRQHIVDGMAIRRGVKTQVEPPSRKMEVHSRRNGWHIMYGECGAPDGLREISKRAVDSLGYQHGAVDVLQGQDEKLYVLEVNSAPSLKDDNTLNAYVKAFSRRMERS